MSIHDPYMLDIFCVGRLVQEWIEHDGLIIAFDFDNTIYDYHNKGFQFTKVVNLLKECKELGCTLVLFTCCDEDKYEFMTDELSRLGIEADYINETPVGVPFGAKKIYYNILLDDRAGLGSAYKILKETVNEIKELKNSEVQE